jgi:glycosyltransferase involved in cell wall biosynthesis
VQSLRIAMVIPAPPRAENRPGHAQRVQQAWKTDPDVEVVAVRFSLLTAISLLRDLAKADVIHLVSPSPLTASFMAGSAALLGRPLIVQIDGDGASDATRVARFVRRDGALTVVDSDLVCDQLRRVGIRATSIPSPIPEHGFVFRQRDPLRPRLLSVRKFEPLDNVAATIRAFAIVQARRPDATLTLVGHGSQEHRLRALAADLQLRGVVFAAPTDSAALAAAYADHDILLQSPNVDNTADAVVQACACGLPVVSTMAGEVPTVLTHGVHALLAPLADYQTLGHHVLRLLAHPEDARALARAARDAGEARRWPHVRKQWLDAYESARLASPRRSFAVANLLWRSRRLVGPAALRRPS